MADCIANVTYLMQQEERFKYLNLNSTAIAVVGIIGIVINTLLTSLIMTNPSLRQKSLGTLKLCVFNTCECLVALYRMKKRRLNPDQEEREIFERIITFLVAGQIIAVAVVTIERIQLVSGTLTSVNNMIRDPSKGKDRVKLIILIIIAVVVNALLSGLVPQVKYLIASIVFINCVLYLILIIKLTSLKNLIHCTLSSIRRKALLYVSALFIGFIFEFMVFFMRGTVHEELYLKYVKRGCVPVLARGKLFVIYLYTLRFVWEPVTYFTFNAAPRALLRKILKRIFCHNVGGPQNENCVQQAAPMHFVEESIQPCPTPPKPTAVVPQETELKPVAYTRRCFSM